MTKKLIRNAIITPDGTFLESKSHYHCAAHQDKTNGTCYMVDGGITGCPRISTDGNHIDAFLFDDEPHDVQREILKWGTYGKNGDEPYHKIRIADMETEHIKQVIAFHDPHDVLWNCMTAELEWRGVGEE